METHTLKSVLHQKPRERAREVVRLNPVAEGIGVDILRFCLVVGLAAQLAVSLLFLMYR